jgi:hypothetical protein
VPGRAVSDGVLRPQETGEAKAEARQAEKREAVVKGHLARFQDLAQKAVRRRGPLGSAVHSI